MIDSEHQRILATMLQLGMDSRQARLILLHGDFHSVQEIFESINSGESHNYYPKEVNCCAICDEPFNRHKIVVAEEFTQVVGGDTFCCQICFKDINKAYSFQHEDYSHDICLTCLREYLQTQINNAVTLIPCPSCQSSLNPSLHSLVVKPLLDKYKLFSRRRQIATDKKYRFCPGIDCQKQILVQGLSKNKPAHCDECGTDFCINCNRLWHPRKTCDQVFKEELKQLPEDTSSCPKCKMMVQKISGCNHMTCGYCSFQFCWICKSTYTRYHFQQFNPFGCPGLQNTQDGKRRCGCLVRWLYKLVVLMAIAVLGPIALLVLMVIGGPLLMLDRCAGNSNGCCGKLLRIILGFLLNPLLWVGAIVLVIPMLIYLTVKYCKQRRQNQLITERALQERLLQEQF